MTGRRTTAGLALLCALLFSAFTAQSAFAQLGTPGVNTRAVTCVLGGGNLDFKDAHCNEKVAAGSGSYGHVAIKTGETTSIDVTNAATSSATTLGTSAILKTTHLGVNLEVSCETVSSSESWIRNTETLLFHTVEGTVKAAFSNCKVSKPANCTIKTPIEAIATFNGVEGLQFGGKNNTMGVEFTQHEGKNFAEFTFEGEKCVFKNKTFPITGSAIATGTPEPSQATQHTGATAVFETEGAMQTLKFSTSNATFTGKFTTRTAGGGNPISLTTVT